MPPEIALIVCASALLLLVGLSLLIWTGVARSYNRNAAWKTLANRAGMHFSWDKNTLHGKQPRLEGQYRRRKVLLKVMEGDESLYPEISLSVANRAGLFFQFKKPEAVFDFAFDRRKQTTGDRVLDKHKYYSCRPDGLVQELAMVDRFRTWLEAVDAPQIELNGDKLIVVSDIADDIEHLIFMLDMMSDLAEVLEKDVKSLL